MTPFAWWLSVDGGERFSGPFATRDDVIAEASELMAEEDGPESIEICEARQKDIEDVPDLCR